MPSRKLSDRCGRCNNKNHLRAQYCNQCGGELNPDRAHNDVRGRARLHADLAHPINSTCRIELHKTVVVAYQEELELSKADDYKGPTFDDFDEQDDFIDEAYIQDLQGRTASSGSATGAQAEGGIEQGA
jgi:stage V sporulation protein G